MRFFRRKSRTYVTKEGYIQHYNPKSPDARNNGFSPVHRDVARKMIGRKIKTNEVVHHIDGNKLNNKKSNLVVLTRSQHYKVHNI